MKVILDPQAGICEGVRRAIKLAEKELNDNPDGDVYVLGDIIHNEREVERLDQAGLKTLQKEDISKLKPAAFKSRLRSVVLVRAHGEPPETYRDLESLGIEIVDGTCPVVTRSQKLARKFHKDGYQVAIVGKHHHPEIIGIVGHTENQAIEIQFDSDIQRLKPNMPTLVMAQTTISPAQFREMVDKIIAQVGEVEVAETICKFVVRREKKLPHFAEQADVILVVGGHKSSNTKMLHKTCLQYNPRSYHLVSTEEIDPTWFEGAEVIGVTGSASTPLWLLEEFIVKLNSWIEIGRLK